jgi:cellulose synthase/poly-beta-1,6-N-acetylglucosamine synthase-like glycosyltransferase
MELIFIIILVLYLIFIGLLIYGFDQVIPFQKINLKPKTTFSIVVPFRNEEAVFLNLLQSISKLNYPQNLFEIIVIDDASDDLSVTIFEKWQTENTEISSRILQNKRTSNSPKKDAITTAVAYVKTEWIITTDADCVVPQNWLHIFDDLIQNNDYEMVAAPVSIKNTKGFLNFFQFVDLLSLQGATIGSFGINKPFMCNGANFGYTKKLFLALNGFDGNDKMASGDDVFLLQKAVKNFSEKVAYLKHSGAIVTTNPEISWSKLFQQRIRWASKTGSYNSFFSKNLAVVVLLVNFLLVGLLVFGIWNLYIVIFLLKFCFDFILLFKTNNFIENRKFFFPLLSSLLYPFFSSFVGIYSLFGKFDWKGRSYRK